MNPTNIELWIEKFKKAWLGKDFAAIREIFKDTEEYYETPESEPFRNIDDIMTVWEPVKQTKWERLDISIKSIEGQDVVMDWSFSAILPNGDPRARKGTYLVKFDATGSKCLTFVRKVEE